MIYPSTAKGPYKVPGFHDPNSKRYIGIMYAPQTWEANKVYYLRGEDDYDVVIPTVFNGFYYIVTSPGKSGGTEPVWPTTVDEEVESGSLTFKAVAYNLMPELEQITTSTWTATEGVTISLSSNTAIRTQVRIDAVPSGVETFNLKNHTIRNNGEEQDVTLQFKVGER